VIRHRCAIVNQISLKNTVEGRLTEHSLPNTQKQIVSATAFGALALSATFILLHFEASFRTRDGVEISTYFQDDQPYDRVGDPVCLTGVNEPIGRIKGVQRADSASSRWRVTMLLDKRYLSRTQTNSVVVRRWRGYGTCKVARGSRWDGQFDWRGRFLDIECQPWLPFWERQTPSPCDPASAAPLKEHAVLESAVDCCGGIVEMVPQVWWERFIHRSIDFVTMNVGLRVEIASAPALAVGAAMVLAGLIRRRRSSLHRVVG
jgi:hypothetical protein